MSLPITLGRLPMLPLPPRKDFLTSVAAVIRRLYAPWRTTYWGRITRNSEVIPTCLVSLTGEVLLYLSGLRVYQDLDRKSTRLNSSHANISYAVFCLKKKNDTQARSCVQ